jgi:hypothetical protein
MSSRLTSSASTASLFHQPTPALLYQMMVLIDETIKEQMNSNLKSYPRFLKASDITEIFSLVFITISAVLSYFGQGYNNRNITIYSGIASTFSLSFLIISRYLNKEAHERQQRINNILQSLKMDRPPVELGITDSNN